MFNFFAIALELGAIEIGIIIFTGVGFLIMFGIGSAKGGYQDLVKTTLNNDKARRNKK